MSEYRFFTGNEPHGTIVVKLVTDENGQRAFIRSVDDPADPAASSIEQSEVMAVEEALALARNKAATMASPADITIELGPDTQWHPEWGTVSKA